VCGNGTQDQGEDCDDGNVEDGDCCSSLCTFEPAGSSCAEDQYCNGEETCDGNGTCQAGTPIDCSDGIDCTVDSCDEVNEVCVNMPNDNNCADDGLFCTGQEICNPVDGCVSSGNPCPVEELCDEGNNQCATSPECAIDEDCNDGLFCNGDELCDVNGICQPGTGPCPSEETCDEESDQCVVGETDLDIAGFRVTKGVRLKRVKDVAIKLVVKNNGGNNGGQRRATITGVQNEEEVYNETMLVTDPPSRGRTTFTFPAYRPENEGVIEWEASIDDDDSDDDTRKVRTVVLP
jgi:cysteine-rich repeat protein